MPFVAQAGLQCSGHAGDCRTAFVLLMKLESAIHKSAGPLVPNLGGTWRSTRSKSLPGCNVVP